MTIGRQSFSVARMTAAAGRRARAVGPWLSIVRLGLVQMALGAIVVIPISTLNRIMVVELGLAAVLPGFLVALHYGVQMTRPTWGFLSDAGGRRTPFIIGGMAALGLGGFGAALGVALFETSFGLGLAASILAYILIGLGVGAAGTSLLALLASSTLPRRRAAAATITWLMMIFGIAVTAVVVGQLLDLPATTATLFSLAMQEAARAAGLLDAYSSMRLVTITGVVAVAAVLVTALALWGLERRLAAAAPARDADATPFWRGLRDVWREPTARRFTVFVFLSMTAYYMQELILEPYAGLVFAFTPGQSTTLSGAQNGGVFLGMLTVGIAVSGLRLGSLALWVILGCVGSATALTAIAALGQVGPGAPLSLAVTALGFSNGVFAVAAIAAMMQNAGEGQERREGTRMGLWGAAQAIAAGFGGLLGAGAADLARLAWSAPADAFGAVFVAEAALFLVAAVMAYRVIDTRGLADIERARAKPTPAQPA